VTSPTDIRAFGGAPVDFSINVLSITGGLPIGDYVLTFSLDANMDEIKDDTYTDSVSVTVIGCP
jgi:hypothetical protein